MWILSNTGGNQICVCRGPKDRPRIDLSDGLCHCVRISDVCAGEIGPNELCVRRTLQRYFNVGSDSIGIDRFHIRGHGRSHEVPVAVPFRPAGVVRAVAMVRGVVEGRQWSK